MGCGSGFQPLNEMIAAESRSRRGLFYDNLDLTDKRFPEFLPSEMRSLFHLGAIPKLCALTPETLTLWVNGIARLPIRSGSKLDPVDTDLY